MILALALTVALLSQGDAIRVPPWSFSPDGEEVAVRGDAPLEADGGRAERVAGPRWRVLPAPGRAAVHLRSGDFTLSVPVAPPPGRIIASLEPPQPIKGRDRSVRLLLEARDADGAPLALETAPRISVSGGKLGPLSPSGSPGRFEARWEPTDSPEPEVLGIVAFAPRCPLCPTPLASGVARFPIAAAIDLPGRTDPGVETRVEIAGRSWGPVRADGDGRFVVPVVVPPGTRWGQATSLSGLGNVRRTQLDLRLAETPGLHCALWPERLAAGGGSEATIFCVTWSGSGGQADPRSLRPLAAAGTVLGASVEGDAWQARYRPPAAGAGTDRLSVTWGPLPAVKVDLTVGLATGPPASIEWQVDGEPAVPGTKLPARARALDARGNRLGEAIARDGALEGGLLRIRQELGDGLQRLTLVHALPPGEKPARVSLRRSEEGWAAQVRDADARPVAGVELRFGHCGRAVSDARGEARCPPRAGGRGGAGEVETVEGPAGLRAIAWSDAPSPVDALEISREVRVALRPPGSTDVVALREGAWIRWTVRGPDGAPVAGRRVSVGADGVDLGPIEREGTGGRCAVRAGTGTVAITDLESGATALLEVR